MNSFAWQSFGASVIGPAHIRDSRPNQDAWLATHASWGDLIVVCDGMGSYRHADLGAQAACRAACAAACLKFQNPEAGSGSWLKLLQQIWFFLISPYLPEDSHCTCLLALRQNDRFFLAQLGDGLICLCNRDGSSLPFGLPEKGFDSSTYGLGGRFQPELWRILELPEKQVEGVLLATDGVADDLREEGAGEFAETILNAAAASGAEAAARETEEFLREWPVDGHSDDKTIAVIYRKDRAHGQS